MAKQSKNVEPTELPATRWEAEPENIIHRLDRAILIAKDHLQGYSDEDIQFIWEVMKTPLFSAQESTYKAQGDTHPPIDRLFDIAFDINGYTNSIIEGEIEPAVICAVYALKTAEHAMTVENPVSSCMICIDAWRALAFTHRAEYLYEKFSTGYGAYDRGGKEKNKGREKILKEYNRQQKIVFDIYKEHQEYFEQQKESGVLTPQEDTNIGHLKSGKLKFNDQYLAMEIYHILEKNGQITIENLEFDQIIRMIKKYRITEKYNTICDDIKSKGIILTDEPLCWPVKTVINNKDENFSGEFKQFHKGNHEKFKKIIRQRVEEQKMWDLTEY